MGKTNPYIGPRKAREKAARKTERDRREHNEDIMRKAGWQALRFVGAIPSYPPNQWGNSSWAVFSAAATSYQFALKLFGHESKMADTGKNKRKPECWTRGEGYAAMESLQRLFDRITRMGHRTYTFLEVAAAAHERDETFRAIDGLARIGGNIENKMLDPIRHTIRANRLKKKAAPRTS